MASVADLVRVIDQQVARLLAPKPNAKPITAAVIAAKLRGSK